MSFVACKYKKKKERKRKDKKVTRGWDEKENAKRIINFS
jgi:hypothetical protein